MQTTICCLDPPLAADLEPTSGSEPECGMYIPTDYSKLASGSSAELSPASPVIVVVVCCCLSCSGLLGEHFRGVKRQRFRGVCHGASWCAAWGAALVE